MSHEKEIDWERRGKRGDERMMSNLRCDTMFWKGIFSFEVVKKTKKGKSKLSFFFQIKKTLLLIVPFWGKQRVFVSANDTDDAASVFFFLPFCCCRCGVLAAEELFCHVFRVMMLAAQYTCRQWAVHRGSSGSQGHDVPLTQLHCVGRHRCGLLLRRRGNGLKHNTTVAGHHNRALRAARDFTADTAHVALGGQLHTALLLPLLLLLMCAS